MAGGGGGQGVLEGADDRGEGQPVVADVAGGGLASASADMNADLAEVIIECPSFSRIEV